MPCRFSPRSSSAARRRVAFVERDRDLAEHVRALGYTAHEPPRHQRLVVHVGRRVQAVRVGISRPYLPPLLHQQDVFKPFGHDQTDAAARAREQRVEHRGAGVHRDLELRERRALVHAPLLEGVLGGFDEALGLIPGRRRRLADDEVAVAVDDERIRHRAAGVHRECQDFSGHAAVPPPPNSVGYPNYKCLELSVALQRRESADRGGDNTGRSKASIGIRVLTGDSVHERRRAGKRWEVVTNFSPHFDGAHELVAWWAAHGSGGEGAKSPRRRPDGGFESR